MAYICFKEGTRSVQAAQELVIILNRAEHKVLALSTFQEWKTDEYYRIIHKVWIQQNGLYTQKFFSTTLPPFGDSQCRSPGIQIQQEGPLVCGQEKGSSGGCHGCSGGFMNSVLLNLCLPSPEASGG